MNFLKKKKNIWLILAILAVIVIALGFIPAGGAEDGHEFWWTNTKVFFAAFGFVGCIVLGIFAKKILNYWLDRKEDYYD